MAGNWQVFTEILNTGMLVAIISDCPLIATLSHFLSSIHRFLLRRRQLLVDNIAGLVLAMSSSIPKQLFLISTYLRTFICNATKKYLCNAKAPKSAGHCHETVLN